MKTIMNVLLWALVACFVLFALVVPQIGAKITLLLCAALCLPLNPVRRLFDRFKIKSWIRAVLVGVLFIVSVAISPSTQSTEMVAASSLPESSIVSIAEEASSSLPPEETNPDSSAIEKPKPAKAPEVSNLDRASSSNTSTEKEKSSSSSLASSSANSSKAESVVSSSSETQSTPESRATESSSVQKDPSSVASSSAPAPLTQDSSSQESSSSKPDVSSSQSSSNDTTPLKDATSSAASSSSRSDASSSQVSSSEQQEPSETETASATSSKPQVDQKTVTPRPAPTTPDNKPEPEPETSSVSAAMDYILNKNTKKFHYPNCRSVDSMAEKNKLPFTGPREEVISMGYDSCGNCHP